MKHGVLRLVFISDAPDESPAAVLAEWGEEAEQDRDAFTAENIYWVSQAFRWINLTAKGRPPTIGQAVDRAMAAIERDNPSPKDYAQPARDKQRLSLMIDMVGSARVTDADSRPKDLLGWASRYFLSNGASGEGKWGVE